MTARHIPKLSSRRWAIGGAVIALCIPVSLFGIEFLQRVSYAVRGGTGEAALWGEPLFYFLIMAVPLAFIGYAVGNTIGRLGGN